MNLPNFGPKEGKKC